MKRRFSAGIGAISITPSAGRIRIIATVAEIVPFSAGRGGRQTDQGDCQSSKKAARRSSSVSRPRFASSAARTRRSRVTEQGVLAMPVSRSLASATGLWKWLAWTRMPPSACSRKLSSGAHSMSTPKPSWLSIRLFAADFGVAWSTRSASATCSCSSALRRRRESGTPWVR
ncbi:hypothetical protein GCM10010964_08900 [Caldovatus sediminis]|uniref:Uncharacterized protein n=1 Tax=Caldovatus sediminis TaxID=2041189 RepID=A0A8J3EBG0_9PROT|nr:hypothetical protein GCM10010964_08900 [Caldovatus sediminis]